MRHRTIVIILLHCLSFGAPAKAQDTTAVGIARAPEDATSWELGREEGRASANEAVVAHRAVIGFALGMPIGFWALPAAATGSPMLLAGEGVGVAMVVGVGRAGRTDLPASLAEHAAARGSDFERGVRDGYAERLRSRRMRATAGGATAGMVTGAGLLLWVVLHSD